MTNKDLVTSAERLAPHAGVRMSAPRHPSRLRVLAGYLAPVMVLAVAAAAVVSCMGVPV